MQQYRIHTGQRNGQTILKEVFCTPPFKVLDIREDRKNPLLELMVMSSSPGILNDDHHTLSVTVADHTALALKNQAYQRIYVSPKGTHQKMQVVVGANAYCSYVPHPTVPHQGASFLGENHIDLRPGSSLLLADILTCGRKHMQGEEIFSFHKYQSSTQIWEDQELLYWDNQYVEPSRWEVGGMGQYEGFTHQGSLFYKMANGKVEEKMEALYERLEKEPNIQFGISQLREDAMLLRILGHAGEQLYRIFEVFRVQEDALINQKIKSEWEQN